MKCIPWKRNLPGDIKVPLFISTRAEIETCHSGTVCWGMGDACKREDKATPFGGRMFAHLDWIMTKGRAAQDRPFREGEGGRGAEKGRRGRGRAEQLLGTGLVSSRRRCFSFRRVCCPVVLFPYSFFPKSFTFSHFERNL